VIGLTAPQSIRAAGFSDDYTPGLTLPNGTAIGNTAPAAGAVQTPYGATLIAIGGGGSALVNGVTTNTPYTAAPLLAFGNGGNRDARAGAGFGMKMVTATGTVGPAAAIEPGFVNRSGGNVTAGQSAFGSASAASTNPT
jgi:hypothetical protein